jgi:hypothetical protein
MTKTALKVTIRDNVRKLLGLAPGASGVSQVMALGFANGTAQRILDATTKIELHQIEALAERLRIQPWQLLVPDLDPERLPDLETRSFRWPFRSIDPEVITGLVGTVATQVENGLLATLATAGISARAPAAPAGGMSLQEAKAEARKKPPLQPAPVSPSLPTKTRARSSTRSAPEPSEISPKAPG